VGAGRRQGDGVQVWAPVEEAEGSRIDARPPQMTVTNPMKCADDSY